MTKKTMIAWHLPLVFLWVLSLVNLDPSSSYQLSNFITRQQRTESTQLYSLRKLEKKREQLVARTFPGEENQKETALQRMINRLMEKQAEKEKTLRYGDELRGEVVDIDEYGAYIHVGGKYSAFLPLEEATLNPNVRHIGDILSVGQTVDTQVIGTMKGRPVLSMAGYLINDSWEKIAKYVEEQTVVEVEILEANGGGATCLLEGIVAFLPGSQAVGTIDASMEGNKIQVKVIEADIEEGKVVVSQREVVGDLSFDFQRGDVVSANVTGIKSFGVFLEVEGGATGLLHVSHISAEMVENPENLFTIGQEVKAMVYEADRSSGKLAFSTKALEGSPGEMLRDQAAVFAHAEENAKKYLERLETERQAREAAAKEIVAGLGGELNIAGGDMDSILSVADSIENILASITGDHRSSS